MGNTERTILVKSCPSKEKKDEASLPVEVVIVFLLNSRLEIRSHRTYISNVKSII